MTPKAYTGEVDLPNGMKMVFNVNTAIEYKQHCSRNIYKDLQAVIATQVAMNEYNQAVANGEDVKFNSDDFLDDIEVLILMRDIFYACLKVKQPDITVEEAGDIMQKFPSAFADTITVAHSNETAVEKKPAAKRRGKAAKN